MMKRFFNSPMTWALLALFALGACTDSETLGLDTSESSENAVSFSTYLGKGVQTRAGATGSIDTEVLKQAEYGFGVFAYYSGTGNYANMRRRGSNPSAYPNFMYNQQVTYNFAGTSNITNWVYSPIKYWPNEVQNGDVDDQVDDQDNDPAMGSDEYGGKVSFFAYAPYVEVSQGTNQNTIDGATPTDNTAEEDNGIIAMSGNKYIGSSAEDKFSDPYVTYALPSGNKKFVDLLWGTKGATNQNVNNEGNTGVTGNPAGGNQYAKSVLEGYTVNANLTKQTTTGVIHFLFKHALAKVGGSYQGTDDGADDEKSTPTNGLMVILDLDDEGEEQGGELEAWEGTAPNANTKYTTKVTVRDIQISAKMLVEDENGVQPGKTGYVTTYYASETIGGNPVGTGLFDLATGQWSETVASTIDETKAVTIEHNVTSDATDGTKVTSSAATLSQVIAEPASVDKTEAAFCNILPLGVTTVAKNVYADDANALVFFPNTWPQLTITIDYIVRTYDKNLGDAFSEVGQKITKTLTFDDPVELNKMYNILIHLGLTSVKFTATVDDWDAGTTTTTTTDENGDPVDITETEVHHDVYNPRNVQNPTTGLTVTATATGTYPATQSDANADVIVATTEAGSFTLAVQAAYTTTGNPTGDVTNNASYTSDADWVTVDAQGNVTIAENNQYASTARAATITVTYDGKTQDIKVKQYSKNITELTTATGLTAAVTATTTAASGSYTLGVDPIGNASIKATIATYDETGNVVATETKSEKVGKKAVISAVAVKDASNDDVANQATFSGNVLQYKENTSSSVYTYTVTVKYMGKTADFTFNQAAATPACAAAHYEYSPAYTYKGNYSGVDPTSNEINYSITRALANTKTGNVYSMVADIARYLGALYRMDNGATVETITYDNTDYTWDTASTLQGSNWKNAGTTLVSKLATDYASLLTTANSATINFTLKKGSNTTPLTIHVTIK